MADYSGSSSRFVVENSAFTVSCRVPEMARIKWHRNGAPVPLGDADGEAGYVSIEKDGVFLASNLTVERARHAHSGNYSCTTFVDNAHEVIVIGGKRRWRRPAVTRTTNTWTSDRQQLANGGPSEASLTPGTRLIGDIGRSSPLRWMKNP